ncbi:phosphate ABC transporter substrate-binding protein PstS family protein [Lacticaseibacillus pabuli]|uniref:Phosphate-binding protein n=1 Tax=Lacticaseibacillus pabuli TaxID=3025672 RepID=A0ABY7WSL2_9LACO|nr:phosphate ABC transporter substrate-binding protein PstS family protein [Lacticaseibacillus sp. KACC 23028]WDF81982.1 phosphate ABC transporter substrate-binding protein PstS family protein [Lacticaseibacillus sp. KACC 23028]
MKKSILFSILAVSALTLTLAGCGSSKSSKAATGSSSNQAVSGKIVAVGSTALQPLVEQAGAHFEAAHPQVKVTIQGGGSGTGLSQVVQGAVTIGNSDIFAEQGKGVDAAKLTDHQVAVVGMTPVVNPDVGIKNVKMGQLRDIFTGKLTNWKQLGGKDEKITVVNRVAGSGTRATFEAAVMDGAKAKPTQEQDSNGTVQKIVQTTPGAISYLALSYVKSGLQALSIDGVKPTAANVANNHWQIWSYEHMYTKGKLSAATAAFLKYMNSQKVQSGLVKKLGYISISQMHVKKDADGKVSTIH